jgi:lysophospholipase L1-like esterase
LAKTVIRVQPALDPQAIPGLSLQNLAQPRRIAIWGDSHIAAGPFIPTLLKALRANGLSVGAHYLPPTMGRANVHLPQLRAYCMGPGWDTELAYASPTPVVSGPALANRIAQGGADSYLWLDLRDARGRPTLRQVRIVYRASAGSALDLSVNGSATSGVTLNADGDGATPSRTLTLRGDEPISTLKLRVTQGRLTLYGFILDDADPPALSFDVFGLPSALVRGWANANPQDLLQTLHGVSYDGVILEYGTNEGNTSSFDRDKYAALLTQALTHVRQVFPSASCVLVGPPDRGVLEQRGGAPGNLLQFSHIHQQIEATQREVGKRFGCAAWNWQDLMGGPGGSYGWFYASPSLMGGDLTHLSPAGYERTGHALARSLGWE